MTKPLDITKPVQTRDGRKARYLGEINHYLYGRRYVFVHDSLPVRAREGKEEIVYTGKDGRAIASQVSQYDIVNIPERTERFISLPTYGQTCENLRQYSGMHRAIHSVLYRSLDTALNFNTVGADMQTIGEGTLLLKIIEEDGKPIACEIVGEYRYDN